MTQYLLFSGWSAVNQSLKLYTSPTLAFYASCATQVTQMLSIKGLFSRSKLQTNPKARALSWDLLRSNKGGSKLVHYYYTTVFILCTLHINTTLNSNSWLAELPFLGPTHVAIITPLLGAYSELQLGARSWSLSCTTSVSHAIHAYWRRLVSPRSCGLERNSSLW